MSSTSFIGPAPAAASVAVPALRRSARLAAKAEQKAEQKRCTNVVAWLNWYSDRAESSEGRDKVYWNEILMNHMIHTLTGPRRVKTFVRVFQGVSTTRSIWMNKCHGIIQDLAVNPSPNLCADQNLIKRCKHMIEILEEMGVNALSRQTK